MIKGRSGKFNVWKAKQNGDPIEGTDYIMNAPRKKNGHHIAYENNVELNNLKNENKDENKRSIRFY